MKANLCYRSVSPLSRSQQNWAHRIKNGQRDILTSFVRSVFYLRLEETNVYLQEICVFEIFY